MNCESENSQPPQKIVSPLIAPTLSPNVVKSWATSEAAATGLACEWSEIRMDTDSEDPDIELAFFRSVMLHAFHIILSPVFLRGFAFLERALANPNMFNKETKVVVNEKGISRIRQKLSHHLARLPPKRIDLNYHGGYGHSDWYQNEQTGELRSWVLFINKLLIERGVCCERENNKHEMNLIMVVLILTVIHELAHWFVRTTICKSSPTDPKTTPPLLKHPDVGFWIEYWCVGGYFEAYTRDKKSVEALVLNIQYIVDPQWAYAFVNHDVRPVSTTGSAVGSGLRSYATRGQCRDEVAHDLSALSRIHSCYQEESDAL